MSEMAPEPQVAEPEAPAAEESWGGPSQEEWQQTQEALGYIASQLQQSQAPQEQYEQPQSTQFDPFAEDAGNQIRGIIREELAPFAQYQQHEQLAEAEERAYDILDDISTRLGELPNREAAFPKIRAYADTLMPETVSKHGFGPQAAEAALEKAYKEYQGFLEDYGKHYHEQRMNQLTNLSGVRQEPSGSSAGSQTLELSQGGDELDVVRKFGGFPGPT